MLKLSPSIVSLFLVITLTICVSCKKSIDPKPEVEIPERTEDQLLKDSVYYYYKLYSLWESSISSYASIPTFTDSLGTPSDVLRVLMSRTPYYSGYGKSYDRFSYFTTLSGASKLGSTLKMDTNEGYGLYFAIGAINDSVAYPIVSMVEGGSSSNLAGIRRGDIVLNLNGQDLKIPVKCSSGDCNAIEAGKVSTIRSLLINGLNLQQMNIQVEKADNQIKNFAISNKSYEINPLLADTVYKYSNKNVGYFAYSSFEEIEDNNHNQVAIDRLFEEYSTNNIKALIVDLRYNGGGYVDAATYIADKIINSSGKGKLMLKYQLNSYLSRTQNSAGSSFKDVYFKKNNNLELETVCFIVTESTASAAEMLINVLKPYMNVKIIAEGTTTYGKPVGFFQQKILGKIGLWVTSFKLLNANDESDYWTGLKADQADVQDYIFTDFGVKEEKMIAAALSYTGAIDNNALQARRLLSIPFKVKIDEVNKVPQKGALKTN